MTGKQKILVVDDSMTMRKIISDELKAGGFEIIEAEDGAKALLQIANNNIPDLITLDIDMPILDGFSTCQKLQEEDYTRFFVHSDNQRVPIIFVTAKDNLTDRMKGFDLGAANFITKPFARGEILAAAKKILYPETHLKNLTVLVADDSATARMVVKLLQRMDVCLVVRMGNFSFIS